MHLITPFKCKVTIFVFPVAEEGKTMIFQKATYYQPFQCRDLSCCKVFSGFPLILVLERKKDCYILSYLLNTWMVVLWVLKCESLPNGSKLIFTFVSEKSCSVLEMSFCGWCYMWREEIEYFSWETSVYSTISEV